MLKIVGVCILLFTIFYISHSMCEKERTRVRLLSEMSRFMHEVRHILTVSMKPLGDVCRDFKTDEPYFASLLTEGLQPIYDTASVSELEARAGDGAQVFVRFIKGFGRGYLSEEIARCDSLMKDFDAIYGVERTTASKRLRVCKTLGVAFSFALVILFI